MKLRMMVVPTDRISGQQKSSRDEARFDSRATQLADQPSNFIVELGRFLEDGRLVRFQKRSIPMLDLNHKEPAGDNADQVDLVRDRTVIDRARHIGKHNPASVRRIVTAELGDQMFDSDSLAFVDVLAAGKMVDAHLSSAQIQEMATLVTGAATTTATIPSDRRVRHLLPLHRRARRLSRATAVGPESDRRSACYAAKKLAELRREIFLRPEFETPENLQRLRVEFEQKLVQFLYDASHANQARITESTPILIVPTTSENSLIQI